MNKQLSLFGSLPNAPDIVPVGHATLFVSEQQVITILPNGREVFGEPHSTPEYAHTAFVNGYGDDVARMNRCHEIGHSLVAKWLGLAASPLMLRLGNGETDATPLTAMEEDAVQAIERFANALNIDLQQVAMGGV